MAPICGSPSPNCDGKILLARKRTMKREYAVEREVYAYQENCLHLCQCQQLGSPCTALTGFVTVW